ncbi:MAG: arginase [Candidatus Eremiobacteraeota bacterium]|nr:arginase [Candidatus Eremiobacteraeota bacterium]
MDIDLLGVPIDLGAGRRGVDMGPSALRIAGVSGKLRSLGHSVADLGDLPVKIQERQRIFDQRARYLPEIARVAGLLAGKTEAILAKRHFPLILGGDHSISIGSISGIAAYCRKIGRSAGVLWIDAHGDFNTPETSPSGNIHGMAAAVVTGLGPARLASVAGSFPKIAPEHLVIMGVRTVDGGERSLIAGHGVTVYTMEDVDRLGMHRVMERALASLSRSVDYLHVSFDVDSVDPLYAPGVGTPVRGGLSYREAHLVMEMIAETGKMTSMDVVEVNPILDNGNKSAELAVELAHSAFGKTIL